MRRCEECQNLIRDCISEWDNWLGLFVIIEALETEESITAATAELMREKLQWLKQSAMEVVKPEAAEAAEE